ncbi:hypothetical protein CXB51_015973 [Gossypium anomalum]|uniref:DUF7745 domain-containing protein n=1 Tax=Gossypium anomalum TaxID=47600 RepID=A0A8J6CWX6_9ROSI|nr:hypothetical protein CXB51_015973 [Gossypium anomalum]
MENGLLDRVEGNVNIHRWSEQTQLEKGDSLDAGYTSELSDYTRISVTQNNIQELKEIWDQWGNETTFWNPAYSCFTFGEVDLVPTVEEYTALLSCPRFQGLILTHPDETKKVDIFALSLYGLIVFPRALGYVDEATTDLFHRLSKRVTSVPAILAETFRSLGTCRKAGAGRFSKGVEWRALWMIPGEILYRCGSFDWVPLLGIWGAIGYAPLLVLRKFSLRQFVPATHGLAQSEFAYRGADYKKRVGEISSAWNKTCRLKGVAISPATTPEYVEWRGRRINDNIPELSVEGARPMEEYLQVMPSELEIMKQ